jgi:hypothetical protein
MYIPVQHPRDPCNLPIESGEAPNFNFTLENKLNLDYSTKHKVIIYKSGINTGYWPIFETNYQNNLNFNLKLDSGDYKTEIKSIYQENKNYVNYCNNGIEVLNFIDTSISNQSGFKVFSTSLELFFEDFLKENSKNKIANIYFDNDPQNITGFDFTNSTGILRSSLTGVKILNSYYDGTSIVEAIPYIDWASWSESSNDTIQIVNIITNSAPYIIGGTSARPSLTDIYYSPPFEIRYRTLANYLNTYLGPERSINFIFFNKNLNLNVNEKQFKYNENQVKLFYKTLAFELDGLFGENEVSPIIKSINNARDIQKQRVDCPDE